MQQVILDFIWDFGYFALYCLMALGMIGIPMAEETLMTFVGSLTAFGHLSYPVAIAASFFGTMTGMLVSYFIGRKFGKPFLYRYGKWLRLTPGRLNKAEKWFQRYGIWTVSFGYFVPGIRQLTCYLAGISEVRLARYTAFAGVGAFVWCVIFISLGRHIGDNWHSIVHSVHRFFEPWMFVFLVLIAVCAVAAVIFIRRHQKTDT